MKKSIFFVVFLLLFTIDVGIADSLDFKWQGTIVQLTSAEKSVEVRVGGIVVLKIPVIDGEDGETKFVDANHDGYPDIMVLREIGIEKYFDIYLFDKNKGTYIRNGFLSQLACPEFDKKTKTVRSTCNQASACEKWEDTYKESNSGYILIFRRGEACNPANGDAFKYEEQYKSGRVIWQKTSRIESR